MEFENTQLPDENSFMNKIRENPWIASTAVVSIIAVVLAIFLATGSLTGNVVAVDDAGKQTIDLVKNAFGVDLVYVSGQELNGVYSLNYTLEGKPLALEVTNDLSFLKLPSGQWVRVADLTPAPASAASDTQETSKEVTKSDKPSATLWVFSYCPYGTQTEKGFIPVYNLLKNKATMDIKFIGAMHGEFERIESLRQLSIQKLYGQDKFMAYVEKFDAASAIGNCNGEDTCLKPLVEPIMTSLGIDVAKVNAYMTSSAPALYDAQEKEAQSLGISGSPTFVVNGVQVQSGRSPSAILSTICSAFNTAPSECSQTLSTTTPSAGFGSSAGSASAASCG